MKMSDSLIKILVYRYDLYKSFWLWKLLLLSEHRGQVKLWHVPSSASTLLSLSSRPLNNVQRLNQHGCVLHIFLTSLFRVIRSSWGHSLGFPVQLSSTDYNMPITYASYALACFLQQIGIFYYTLTTYYILVGRILSTTLTAQNV